MAERSRAGGSQPYDAQIAVEAVGEHAGAAVRAGTDPSSAEARAVIEHVEATSGGEADRTQLGEQIKAFADRRVFCCWTLLGMVNGWPHSPVPEEAADTWEWYASALRAHAGKPRPQ